MRDGGGSHWSVSRSALVATAIIRALLNFGKLLGHVSLFDWKLHVSLKKYSIIGNTPRFHHVGVVGPEPLVVSLNKYKILQIHPWPLKTNHQKRKKMQAAERKKGIFLHRMTTAQPPPSRVLLLVVTGIHSFIHCFLPSVASSKT